MTDHADLDPLLLEVLACPQCHGALALDADSATLTCENEACGLVYPIRDGIPVLLIDEAIVGGESGGSDR
jgi:uncharacterized protein